jgi:hypothetical protein
MKHLSPFIFKCSKFVYDVAREAKANLPIIDGGEPRAGDLADPNAKMKNWRVLGPNETSQPGDIAAYPLSGGDAYSGHTGFIVSDGMGGTQNCSAHGGTPVGNDPKQFVNDPGLIFRRYTGQ